MKYLLVLILASLLACKTPNSLTSEKAQIKSAYLKKHLTLGYDTLPYRLLLPTGYKAEQEYPLVLFLHGSGERGNDNELQLVHGADLFLQPKVRRDYPALVVFPQCAKNANWSGYTWNEDGTINFNHSNEIVTHQKLLTALLLELNQNYSLDNDRLYIGGLSMGGMGTFETVRQNPKLFAAAFSICGGADPRIAKELIHPKWWIFHGAEDKVVFPFYSSDMNEALQAVGAEVKFSLYPEVGHDSWNNVFVEPKLLEWLFRQRK